MSTQTVTERSMRKRLDANARRLAKDGAGESRRSREQARRFVTPRGNQDVDEPDLDRSTERIWTVLGG